MKPFTLVRLSCSQPLASRVPEDHSAQQGARSLEAIAPHSPLFQVPAGRKSGAPRAEGKTIYSTLAPWDQVHARPTLGGQFTPSLPAEVLLTFEHDPPAGKKDLAERYAGVGLHGLVSAVQAEHEGLDEGVAVAESDGEDVGDARVHRVVVATVRGQVLPHGLRPQHQGQVIPVSDDLKESHSEWPLRSPSLRIFTCS